MSVITWPHYKIINLDGGFDELMYIFPKAEADVMNFCLFSTSGVHGSYVTIEDIEEILKKRLNKEEENGSKDAKEDDNEEDEDEEMTLSLTFLVVHPRLVTLKYGNILIETMEQIQYLKKLRQTSWEAVAKIGRDEND